MTHTTLEITDPTPLACSLTGADYPFLTMNLHAADGRLVVEVIGPEPAAPIIEELFA